MKDDHNEDDEDEEEDGDADAAVDGGWGATWLILRP